MISIIWKKACKIILYFSLEVQCNIKFSPTKDIQINLVHLYKSFLKLQVLFDLAEELSDMRKQMKALEEKNVTYMKETMNLQEVLATSMIECATEFSWIFHHWILWEWPSWAQIWLRSTWVQFSWAVTRAVNKGRNP